MKHSKKDFKIPKLNTDSWYVERLIYLIAGIFVLTSIVLTLLIHPNFIYPALLVALMLIFFALTGYCPMYIILKKFYEKPNSTN